MCAPECMQHVVGELSRRGFFKGVAAAAAAAASPSIVAPGTARAATMSFSKVVDLTHTLWPEFPTFFGKPGLEFEVVFRIEKDGFNLKKWHLNEHTGTHLDAPIHFSKDKIDASQIPAEQLVVPLVVVNVAAKAEANADYQLTPDDLKTWEGNNGPIPDGACLAMNSGWDRYVKTDKFRNADNNGVMHFPGVHPEATDWLLKKNVAGLAVDTLSLDFGASKDFKTHYEWLPAVRWGLENVANLGQVPEKGATLVVGGPKIAGATGGPCRLIALV
jgi:kynurenine formamidase